MNEKKQTTSSPDFELLYEKLRTPEAEATVRASDLIWRDVVAADEIAESLAAPSSWPPFTTYLSG